MTKTFTGNYFEDFKLGQIIRHATPRTVTVGDASLYTALYGTRFAVQSSDAFAAAIGYPRAPIDDLLVFHIVFGKTVPDISLNAVANLGYANCRFLAPVYPGDTLSATSAVIGRAFVLFTSYQFLNRAADRLRPWAAKHGYPLFCQGDGLPAPRMLEQFRTTPRAVRRCVGCSMPTTAIRCSHAAPSLADCEIGCGRISGRMC